MKLASKREPETDIADSRMGKREKPVEALASRKVFMKNEDGSAVVEFILLAIPLFLPVIIYLAQFGTVSAGEIKARSFAREIVRAYVSGDSENTARDRSALVVNFGAERLGFSQREIASFSISFSCSNQPCFGAGGRVRVNFRFLPDGVAREIQVSAEEYISPWQ